MVTQFLLPHYIRLNLGLRSLMQRRGSFFLIMLPLAFLLSACGENLIPTEADFESPEAMAGWACGQIKEMRPYFIIICMVLGVIGIFLVATAKFAAGVLPGGVLSWTNQHMNNLVIGSLILVLGPFIALAFFKGILSGAGIGSSCSL